MPDALRTLLYNRAAQLLARWVGVAAVGWAGLDAGAAEPHVGNVAAGLAGLLLLLVDQFVIRPVRKREEAAALAEVKETVADQAQVIRALTDRETGDNRPGSPLLAALLAPALLLAAGCGHTPHDQYAALSESVDFSLQLMADAKDAGLLSPDEVAATKPYTDTILELRANAKARLDAGEADAARALIQDAKTVLLKLGPVLRKIEKAGGPERRPKPTTRDAEPPPLMPPLGSNDRWDSRNWPSCCWSTAPSTSTASSA